MPDADGRDYTAIATAQKQGGSKTLYDRVAEMPEQTWSSAWAGIPRKKSDIYFPLSLDGGRHKFQLNADGSLQFRSNDHFLKGLPGQDTPRLPLETAPLRFEFGFPTRPVFRTLQEESSPVCITRWDVDGVTVEETAFATELDGAQALNPAPAADAFGVFMARLVFTNATTTPKTAAFPMRFKAGTESSALRADDQGLLWNGGSLRGQVSADGSADDRKRGSAAGPGLSSRAKRGPLRSRFLTLFSPGRASATRWDAWTSTVSATAVAGYWRRQLDRSARLITPEPMLNEFYRSHADASAGQL